MFDSETAKYFYDVLSATLTDSGNLRVKLLKHYRILKEVINKIVENENRIFSSNFAKTVFIIDNYQIPEDITSVLKKFRFYATSASRNRNYSVKDYQIQYGFVSIAKLINLFSEIELPPDISIIVGKFEDKELIYKSDKTISKKIELIRCVIIEKVSQNKEFPELICESDDFGTIKVQLNPPWKEIYNIVWKNAVIHFIDVISLDKNNQSFKTTFESLLVLEPDYLMDATELAECFQNSGANPNLYFLKKFFNSSINESMVAGNLINSCLDELLINPEVQFKELYDKALMYKPLQIFVLALKDKTSVQKIHDKVAEHFANLKETIKQIKYEIVTVEPTFISPRYGLQGRLDILLEYYDNPKKKDIIELKSGKGPEKSAMIKTFD